MTEIVSTILAVGGILPLLTSVLQQPQWSAKTRTYVGVGVSVLAGLVAYVAQYGLDLSSPSKIVTVVIGVVLAASTAYKTIWKSTGIAETIENNVFNTSKDKAADKDVEVAPEPDVEALPDPEAEFDGDEPAPADEEVVGED